MRRSKGLTGLGLVTVVGAAVAFTTLPASAQEQPSVKAAGNPTALAQTAADNFVAHSGGDAAVLFKGPGDTLVRKATFVGGNDVRYNSYDRLYRGLKVAGGDAVVATDVTGAVKAATTAQQTTINVPTTAKVSSSKATAVAKAQLKRVDDSAAPKLVVDAYGKTPRLAWEVQVAGLNKQNGPSKLHVFVDALTGKVLDKADDVRDGTGTGNYYGTVTLSTTLSGSTYSMKDSARSGLQCEKTGSSVYTNTTDVWGTGSGTDLVTACVDAMYGTEKEIDMLTAWFGRSSIDGSGNAFPINVGLSDVNAYWDGSSTNFGHNQASTKQATSIDVVAHEFGHAIFQYTPGGAGSTNENGGINEGASDIWGALTEAYANNPKDTPDYTVGELVDLVGTGSIRYMYNPSIVGDPNCYTSAIPSTEVHSAAGPLNHWFYLLAEGTSPTDGQPTSPTCNSSTVTGLGIQTAGKIFYNAELLKTSTWTYAKVRTASLTAAKTLFPSSCTEFNTVKAAWDAVSVSAQSGDPTCSTSSNDFSVALSPTSGSVAAGSSTTSTVSTAVTSGSSQTVALSASGLPTGATATFSPTSVTAGGSSTLTIATTSSTPSGTYTVAVTGTGSATHSASYTLTVTGGTSGGCSGTNGTDVSVPDAGSAVYSNITISGCSTTPSTTSTVEVHIVHTYRGDLRVQLVAPDGSTYTLKSPSYYDSTANVDATYTGNLSSETANGTWRLKVQDVYSGDTGYINSWTLTL